MQSGIPLVVGFVTNFFPRLLEVYVQRKAQQFHPNSLNIVIIQVYGDSYVKVLSFNSPALVPTVI